MKKNVGRVINFAQLFRIQKTRQLYSIGDFKSASQFFQLRQHWTFTGDGQGCFGIVIQKNRERVQGCRDAFLLNEPTGLEKAPFSIRRKLAFPKWKFLQRDPGPDDFDLAFVTTKV